ncbi:2-succinyl-5-enolpyruvyl-6-hydroxy-3-cyclohexene-1-carboxylic-acid synthase [Vibrio sp. CAIM 722]|uniref:2-succinyl-5-enolpyruvyl-6-hydroxy-3-cyclohexene-1-carboxylate synthase n=1 Tax=Vibrio eleionomae TaxID=2653505 RepID=A0A7X4LI62_9VIBR|nr:2-succinyl-5-enolpyruvyl-6-hydroxy-3-cyclohexene-1-carboxylic-acid synthase [Vibrio eleionomae]MZI92210.1 2-succinyl-5-enolpyruvyl-6-hydroxy-3-cyclohexene-1-carboxylic-acid synthase [Vibrio eleionomae]
MSHDQAVLNRIWSRTLLAEFARLGVKHVCAAPGSRSTPLTLEADQNSQFTLHTHFDERGLGFMALGLAKASQEPVIVIVTSGTAVANLLPAIAESKLTGEQLIILSSDRPVELVDCGANQAINQVGIYSSHVNHSLNLPSPNTQVPLAWLLTSIDNAYFQQQQTGGSIHINCPYPEPLYSNCSDELYQDYLAPLQDWTQSSAPYCERYVDNALMVPQTLPWLEKKGVVIIGAVELNEAQAAKQFADELGWPCLCDPQSGVGSEWAFFDIWLQNQCATDKLSECEHIVQFGARIVSKRLNQWLSQQVQSHKVGYDYISSQAERQNQTHLPQHHWVCDIAQWVEQRLNQRSLFEHQNAGWGDELKRYSMHCRELSALHLNSDKVSEVAIALDLNRKHTSHTLFLGNSLVIRLADMFSDLPGVPVYANRGASGIDGLVATAAGVQRATQQPLLMLIGDTSLLYDLNSLAMMRHTQQPTVIVVTNNDGGAIFDLLPVPAEKRQKLYQMPHGMDFSHAAAQFGLAYLCPETVTAYQTAVDTHLSSGRGTLLIEIKSQPEEASQHIKQLVGQIKQLG